MASFSRQIPAPWLKLDTFLLSLLTDDCDVTAGPPSAPSKAIHTKKDFNPLPRGLPLPPALAGGAGRAALSSQSLPRCWVFGAGWGGRALIGTSPGCLLGKVEMGLG